MTKSSPEGGEDLESRLAQLESTVAAIGRALEGNTAWLTDLERSSATRYAEVDGHSQWLATMERWVSSCVRLLSNFGEQPLDSLISPSTSTLDPIGSLLARSEVATVMSWIADAADVPESLTVSVNIATHNRPGLIEGAIASVLRQSYSKFELVVVNDSDEDETGRILAEIRDPRLRVCRPQNRRGAGAAYNEGLDASNGDLITFLDDDNLMHRDWLRSIVWAFTAFPDLGALYGARINEDAGAQHGERSGMLPTLEFSPYDRARHERANFVDRNTMAMRAQHRDLRYDETLAAAFDWDHSLRLFTDAPPLALPVVSGFYRTVRPDRLTDIPGQADSVRLVRARAHTTRPLRVLVHTEMYPVISETYIGEDIDSLVEAGADVTISSLEKAASVAENKPLCRLDLDEAIEETNPDVVLMHWATHAETQLELMERHGTPFACRAHTFDVESGLVERLLAHPLCVAVFAHPHHLNLLPAGVQPLIPTVGPNTHIPESPSSRDVVLSVSAGLPKKDFPFLIDVMAQLPDLDRRIILARTNGVLDLPDNVTQLAAQRDPGIKVDVNVAHSEALAANARASVLVYTLAPESNMGFPMSIVEAMLCGTIVIAPDRPEAHTIVGPELRAYRSGDDIVGHVREVMAGGPAIESSRKALRARGQRHRDPAERHRLYDSLRDGLTAWRLRGPDGFEQEAPSR